MFPSACLYFDHDANVLTVTNVLIIIFFTVLPSENAAEAERDIREVRGPRLSRRSVSEAENGRPHPGCLWDQPGRYGVQHVSTPVLQYTQYGPG